MIFQQDDVPSFDVSVRAMLEYQKIKLYIDKEESHKAAKIAGD